MKKVLILILCVVLNFGCATEKRTVDTVMMHDEAIEAIAKKLFKRHFTETLYTTNELSGDLTKKELRLLKNKLRCEKIYLFYNPAETPNADSLVIFTRGGTWAKEHTVVVDMRKRPRPFPPAGLTKLTNKIYYRSVQAVIPIS